LVGWILSALLLLLLIVAVTPLRIVISYGRVGSNDRLTLEVSAWFRLIRFAYELPVLQVQGGEQGPELVARIEKKEDASVKGIDLQKMKRLHRKYQQLLDRVHDFQPIAKRMMRRVQCREIEWHTTLGVGEAAGTGALTGLVWGAKSMLIAGFSRHISLRAVPRFSVQPVWNNRIIRTQFRCILTFRLGHAIIAGVRILIKLAIGRQQKWRTTPSRA
jgi:hypothetical protein